VVASGTGTGTVKWPYVAGSVRNPGLGLKGLGKLTKFNLSSVDQARINSLGYSTPDFYELPKTPDATARFQESIIESKNQNPFGGAVYVYSPEEYSGMRLFLSKDGGTGFALKEDDIVSVFNTKRKGVKGTTLSALMLAVQEGGRKLDAFDSLLPQIYSKAGFRISSRTAWSDDFAPPEWNKELFKKWNQGEPDVVFMHYDPDSTEVFDQLSGAYNPEDQVRNSLLRGEYDDAVELQTQNVLESQQRFKKLKRLPGEEAERLGFDIPKAPWKVEERSLVPAAHTQVAVDKILEGLPLSRRLELTPEQSLIGGGSLLPPGPIFTSPALNAVREISKDALPANQWLKQLQGRGVKEDEIVWTGVGDWLKSRKGNVSKAELEQYLDANQIQIQEVLHGSQGESVELFPDASATKFSDPKLQLPGGENYRELVLTLPSVAPVKGTSKAQWMIDTGRAQNMPEAARLLDSGRFDQEWTQANKADYLGGHYDEPNVVAHIRFNERTDADGNKVLFIEEIQSDWAQKGRAEGVLTPERTQRMEEAERRRYGIVDGLQVNPTTGRKSMKDLSPELRLEYDRLTDEIHELKGGVPEAPFIMDTNQWVALSLKRMVRWAADNKFDKIGWTTGAQQAARYDLSKQVNKIEVFPGVDTDTGEVFRTVSLTLPREGDVSRHIGLYIDKHGIVSEKLPPSTTNLARQFAGKPLDEVVGKEMAKKILDVDIKEKRIQVVQSGGRYYQEGGVVTEFSGEGLQVGGEGMKAFYDQIINNQAKALGKKYGAKVESEEIVTGSVPALKREVDQDGHSFMRLDDSAAPKKESVWTLNLTPKLREAARKGLPYMVVLPPVVIGSQMMQQESPPGKIEMFAGGEWIQSDPVQVPAAQVRASRILEEAVP
jgi:hypothetical protein